MQRAVKLISVVFLYILRRNIQLTLGCAFAILCGNLRRVSGNAELLLGGVVEVEHIQSAAVSALVGRTGVFDAQRIGNAAGNLGPGTIVQLLPLIAYAVVLAAVRIFIVSVILNRCGCQGIRIDRQNRLLLLAVNRYRNIGIACCGLGAAGQRFAVNAVALLLSLVVVAGLNLIFILGIGRQVLIRVAEGVGAVIVTLTIGERHKCEFLASGAVREVVVAVQLETGNDLVVGPRQGDGIIGGFRNILLKILRQRRRSLRLGYRVGNNRERLIAAAVVVAENTPVHAVAVRLGFNRHVLQRTGERAACGVDRYLAGRAFRTCHNACGYAACACTGLGFDRGGVGVVFAVRGGEADLLRDAGAAACRGEVNLSRIAGISLSVCVCVSRTRIAGRITDRMRQHAARNGWQNAVILGDIFVVGQVDQTDRGFVRDGNGGGYFSVAALAIRDIGGILVNLHRDGIERHSVLAGGCLVGDGLLERGGVLGLVGETGGKGGFRLNAADLNAEYREFLLKGDVCANRDGRGGAGAVLGALHARVGGGGLGIVAGQVITVEQIGEVRRRSQYRQNLRVGVGVIVLAGVGHVAGIVVRVGETERVRAVDIGFYRLRAVKQVDGRKSGRTRRAGGVRCCLRCSSIYIADESVVIGLFTEQLVPPALVVGTALVLRYFTGDVVGVRLLVFILGHRLRQGEQRTRTCGVVVFIHRGGHRACGCIVLNVVLIRHSRRVVKRLLDIQTILVAGDNKAVKVQQIAGFAVIIRLVLIYFACGRTGDNRRIGRAQRQRTEGIVVLCHCTVDVLAFIVLGEQIEILRNRRLEGDAVPCVQAYIARVLLICLEVGIRLSRQNQRFAAAGHIAEGEGCADQIAALVGQREFLRALQHVCARGAEHNNGTRACVLLRTVVVTPGAGEIVYAVLVDVTADERDHVGNDTALTEEVRPRLSPVRGIGVIFSLQVVNLNAGIADLRHIDRNLVLTVVVPVAGSYLQVVFQLIRIFCEVFDLFGGRAAFVAGVGQIRVADFLAGVQQRDRLAVLAGFSIAESQVQTAFRAQVTGVNHDRLRGLGVTARGEMACGYVCHSVIGTILQIGSSIGHAGQIALGGIAVIALAACRELCVCASRGGSTLGDFLGIGFSRQKLLSLGRCVIIIAVQRALKGIVLLVGFGNACIAFLCAFTLVQVDFIRRQNITCQTNGIQLVHRRNLDGIAPVWVAGVVGIKAIGRFARINTERRKRVRAAGIRRRCADIKRAAYAGDKSQCQSKAYAAFEFHGIFLLFLFCGAVERAAPAEKRLKIACAYHSSFAACCAVGHTKCPIFDTKYTDRKNRVNYA